MGLYIAISGSIASGKTTLTKKLSDRFGWKPYYESVKSNPYLESFYSDMRAYALPLQTYFLINRFSDHKEIISSGNSSIQDRTIYEDHEIFSRNLFLYNNMSERDYMTYRSLFDIMTSYLKPPDLIIYLKAELSTLKRRIIERGRDYEQNISLEYLRQLNERYDEWIESCDYSKIITIPIDKLDFKNNENDFNYISEKIVASLEQPELFLPD